MWESRRVRRSADMAAPQGFEPRYADPESAVLPLNEGAIREHPDGCSRIVTLFDDKVSSDRGQTRWLCLNAERNWGRGHESDRFEGPPCGDHWRRAGNRLRNRAAAGGLGRGG